jgi:hypothetical protein
LFLNKSVERVQSSTTQTPDPTSVEFQEAFASVIRDSLSPESKKLLIVVDNLDRVDENDARAIWATLRTFFDFDGRKSGTYLDRLWLLVPFDISGIARLWDQENRETSFDESTESERGSVTDSFLAKTFQITFRVAPPVLSDWQDFLKSQLAKAFPKHLSDDFHRVYRIYDLRVVRGTAPPTPRDLKLFVNRMGAIHRQWQDDIPLPVQALYAVLSGQNEERFGRNLALRTDEEILSTVPVDMVGPDWRESIAAIHFNVPKERALQVLIGSQLTKALLSADEDDKLEQMAAVPGFYGVLEKLLEENQPNWLKGETNNLAYSAAALSKIKEIDDASWKRSWQLMNTAARKVEQWTSFGPQTAAGITELLQRDTSNQLQKSILTSLPKSLPQATASTSLEDFQIDPWLVGIEHVFETLLKKDGVSIETDFIVPGNALMYIRVMARAAAREGLRKYRKYFLPEAAPVDIVAELARIISEAKFDDAYASSVTAMQDVSATWPWSTFMIAAKARLQFTGSWVGTELKGLLRALVTCHSGKTEADAVLGALTKGGYIHHHLYQVSKDVETASLCVIAILETLPGGNLEQAVGNAHAGASIFNEIIRTPESKKEYVANLAFIIFTTGRLELLFGLPQVAPQDKPFVNAVLNHMATKWEKSYRFIRPAEIIEQQTLFKDALTPEQFGKLVEESIANRSFMGELLSRPFEPSLVDLYLSALKWSQGPDFTGFLSEGLRSLSADTWLGQLRDEGLLLDLLFHLIDLGVPLALTVYFEDALSIHAELLAGGGVVLKRFQERWSDLIRALEPSFRLTALQRILESTITAEALTDPLLQAYGDLLSQPETINFAQDKNRLVLYGFEHMLQRRRSVELSWMLKVLQQNANLLSEVNFATRRNFEERLGAAAREQAIGEEIQSAIQSIAKVAGIDLNRPKDLQETDTQVAGGQN